MYLQLATLTLRGGDKAEDDWDVISVGDLQGPGTALTAALFEQAAAGDRYRAPGPVPLRAPRSADRPGFSRGSRPIYPAFIEHLLGN